MEYVVHLNRDPDMAGIHDLMPGKAKMAKQLYDLGVRIKNNIY
jgi:hypothetical protein